MAASIFLLALLAAAAKPDAETGIPITLRDDALRIADIAIAPSGGDRIIARLPSRVADIVLTEEQRHSLLRSRVPGGQFRLRHAGLVRVERGAAQSPAHRLGGPCYTARTDLPAGTYLDRDAVTEAACKAEGGDRRLGYDAGAGAAMVRGTIPAGTYLGRLRPDDRAPIASGKTMVLRTRIGPVTVERTVTSLQPGRHGKRLFVRTGDGKLLASRLADAPSPEDR